MTLDRLGALCCKENLNRCRLPVDDEEDTWSDDFFFCPIIILGLRLMLAYGVTYPYFRFNGWNLESELFFILNIDEG